MDELKAEIVTLLGTGPKTLTEVVAAMPDDKVSRVGKALQALAKEDKITWAGKKTISLV